MRRVITAVALLALAACARQIVEQPAAKEPSGPPNVVLMIGDGFGTGAWSMARVVAGLEERDLAMDSAEAFGFLETQCLDQLVTDSAAAATAWSTGRLTPRFQVGFPEEGVPTLFERLRENGRAFGFVTTARVTHATPAPFYARAPERSHESSIAEQLVAAKPDVALGGGARYFLPEAAGGRRTDERDLLAEAEEAGTAVLRELAAPLPEDAPVLAVLASSHLPHELDRAEDEPELAEMAVAAVRRLASTGRPWFLLVEAARIDHAAHDHDGPGVVASSLALDRAVEAVLRETERTRTLVILGSDHETSNPTFHELAHPESLRVVRASVDRMESRIFEGHPWSGTPRALLSKALPVLDEGARHTGLDARDIDRLLRGTSSYDRRTALGNAVSRRFGVLFLDYDDHLASVEVHGHHGDLVPVRAWGPRAAEIRGIRDHAELGRWLSDVLELPAAAIAAPIDSARAAG